MSMFSSFMHPERGYQKANEQLGQRYEEGKNFTQPYNAAGQATSPYLFELMKYLMHPEDLQNNWAKGYNESESAKGLEEMAKQHGLNAASALGLNGSTPALNAIQAGTTSIVANDRQNYMNDLFKKLGLGTSIGQNIYGVGANTANNMAQNANNVGQNEANMAYGEENAQGNLLTNILGSLGGIAGGALSGPLGGALVNKLGWTTTGSK